MSKKIKVVRPGMIVQDQYTNRLINALIELVKRKAVRKKIDFVALLGKNDKPMSLNMFYQIETNKRNFPIDDQRRKLAAVRLFETFGINPDYLLGRSETVFLRDPIPVNEVVKKNSVQLEYYRKKDKETLLLENEELRAENSTLKTRVEHLERLLKSHNISDK